MLLKKQKNVIIIVNNLEKKIGLLKMESLIKLNFYLPYMEFQFQLRILTIWKDSQQLLVWNAEPIQYFKNHLWSNV